MLAPIKPTLITDRGIATKGNLALLKEKGYPYTVIERRQAERDFTKEFMSLDSFSRLKEGRFIEELESAARSVAKGSLKRKEKVWQRVGRIHEKYPSVAKYYTITAKEDGNDVLSLEWSLKEEVRSTREILTGCYVIESTHQELTAAEIWQMYMTILQVESAFRTLKSDLGLRPIHHIRLSGTPEAAHQDIYHKLDIKQLPCKQVSYVATRL
ncbi:MAG: hypothetical protein DDT37_00073 [Firmicutes bacterium]|nr:hypothetical protein [candidate division NPL-UPA2 bacterium]